MGEQLRKLTEFHRSALRIGSCGTAVMVDDERRVTLFVEAGGDLPVETGKALVVRQDEHAGPGRHLGAGVVTFSPVGIPLDPR
ncbi:hypothetical protein AB0K43_20470 [Kitasatospora sp. NPDC049258]|uniref:hypothetical protein n=1 Tax=Kitasatospora sp. NPDC049258 TaxID=3155394 RepID=UPI0034311624